MDINKCMELLANRESCRGHHKEGEDHVHGQVIDMSTGINETNSNNMDDHHDNEERNKIAEDVKNELNQMNPRQLLKSFQDCQEARVTTYRSFNDGLAKMLSIGVYRDYQQLCAATTASFASLSDTINIIIELLKKDGNHNVFVSLIIKIQSEERNKLTQTAALHLEKIRRQQANVSSEDNVQLLDEGIERMNKQISELIENINEFLDEIRLELMDM